MIFKTLTKSEKDEGLTLEHVNTIGFEFRKSPAIFQKGDEPVSLVECSKGYWVLLNDGTYLREGKELMVFNERHATLARARYLLHHGKEEKAAEAAKLLAELKLKCQAKLNKLYSHITSAKSWQDPSNTMRIIADALLKETSPEKREAYLAEREAEQDKLPELENTYIQLKALYDNDKIVDLAQSFGILSSNPLMFSAKLDNPKDMQVLKNVFSASALEANDFNIDKIIVALEVEKKYNSLTP